MPCEALSPMRPPPKFCSPTWITPFEKVPVVRTTQGARNSLPRFVRTPVTVSPASSVRISFTMSDRIFRLSMASSSCRMARA
jgi:hypothetical protein